MIEFVISVLLWLLIFIPSSVIASFTIKDNPKKAALMMQLAMLFLSLTAMEILRSPKDFGFTWSTECLFQAFVLGFGSSFAFNLFGETSSRSMPGFLPEGAERYFLLLFLAPLSEEALNRGLVEGYLLNYGHFWSAVIFSAVLFAFPHWRALGNGIFKEKAGLVLSAFIIGALAGYLFALSHSIVPAFALHSSANLAGLAVLNLRETSRYK